MYYYLKESLNKEVVGHYFQSESVQKFVMDDLRFLTNNYFKKLDFEPITPIAILHKKAKITDLISNVSAGGGFHLLISDRLKTILERYCADSAQLFKSRIVKDNTAYDNFWSMNMYRIHNNFIDFNRTLIKYRRYDPDKINETQYIEVKDPDAYERLLDSMNMFDEVNLYKVVIKGGTTKDFFMVKFPSNYVVSEKLKQEIEDAGCTGIEFQPTDLSFDEWIAPGGERERIYGRI